MKTLRLCLSGLAVMALTFVFQSCLDDDDDDGWNLRRPTALVTVKPNPENLSFYMQLNDSVLLRPTNIQKSPFGAKEVRALVNYTVETVDGESATEGLTLPVTVNWIDSILTKPTAPDLAVDNAKTYGTDPVEIINDWVTIAEDGYLTLRFRTNWGYGPAHLVNLVVWVDEKGNYRADFYHDAKGDLYGQVGDALVAFKLDALPDTEGRTVDLKLSWNSYSGNKEAIFKYSTRQATQPDADMIPSTYVRNVQ